MIYLTIKGRLGNQMFQYAMARALQEKLNTEILIDWHHVIESDKREPSIGYKNSLCDFNVSDFKSIDQSKYRENMSLRQYLTFRSYEKNFPFGGNIESKAAFERNFYNKHKHSGLLFFENGYMDFDLSKLPKNIFLSGYYESTKYFENIKDKIKQEFTPIHPKLEHNIALYDKIENTNSVCVTVRRGDFVKSSFHNVCRTEYFLKGMDIIAEKVDNPHFFIFSNDVDWLKQNVNFKYPVTFETGNDPVWEKLRMMYSCKHFVISNSTFSWWAQFLSKDENKVVVSPDRWYNSKLKSDLIENSDFIKIICD